ncbi:MAG: AzlD domain-containing protein [Pseudomonadota bacterium]|nr:AzlD domain-containing protein [Pseudomonadota bacterium]
MSNSDLWALATVIGMTAVTVLTRCFFFLSTRAGNLPGWAQRGLQYAPIAALAAVIVPEILMTHGHLIGTWRDARLFAVFAATAWYVWRRGLLGTIVAGMAVYLLLHLAFGF